MIRALRRYLARRRLDKWRVGDPCQAIVPNRKFYIAHWTRQTGELFRSAS